MLMGLIGLFSMGLGMSSALAMPLMPFSQSDDASFEAQVPTVIIEPELTSPAETPIEEAPPQQISALDWLDGIAVAPDVIDPEEASLDTLVNQWLASVQSLFSDR